MKRNIHREYVGVSAGAQRTPFAGRETGQPRTRRSFSTATPEARSGTDCARRAHIFLIREGSFPEEPRPVRPGPGSLRPQRPRTYTK